ncbi:MAG: class IV adenylate cyclase [Oscillospiraceae bacterium]
MLEVEVKAEVVGGFSPVLSRAEAAGYSFFEKLTEVDSYFLPIIGGEAKKDSALRVRKQIGADSTSAFLTYKGPLCSETINTRQEIEFAVGDAEAAERLLLTLGHKRAPIVKKERSYFKNDRRTLTLDTVDGLGLYLELEIIISEDGDAEEAEKLLLSELQKLLPGAVCERKTYLRMLMDKEGAI